jgi:hypothetical protein
MAQTQRTQSLSSSRLRFQRRSTRRRETGSLAGFADLMLVDSTLVRLHDLLAKAYPGTRTNHSPAAIKAHLVYSVTGEGDHSLKVTSGRTNDGPILRAGAWVKDRLLLFDLGYYRFRLWLSTVRVGSSTLGQDQPQRQAHRSPPGTGRQGKKFVGMKLQEAIPAGQDHRRRG